MNTTDHLIETRDMNIALKSNLELGNEALMELYLIQILSLADWKGKSKFKKCIERTGYKIDFLHIKSEHTAQFIKVLKKKGFLFCKLPSLNGKETEAYLMVSYYDIYRITNMSKQNKFQNVKLEIVPTTAKNYLRTGRAEGGSTSRMNKLLESATQNRRRKIE